MGAKGCGPDLRPGWAAQGYKQPWCLPGLFFAVYTKKPLRVLFHPYAVLVIIENRAQAFGSVVHGFGKQGRRAGAKQAPVVTFFPGKYESNADGSTSLDILDVPQGVAGGYYRARNIYDL